MKKFFTFAVLVAIPYLAAVDEKSPLLKDFLKSAAEYPVDDPAELAKVPMLRWESHREYRIVFSNREYYSFKAVEKSYTGGAHGMTKTVVGTFYRGRRLKLADLSSREKLEKAWQLAIARHFKAESFTAHVSKINGFKPFMTENFYLDDKGIHFIYDPIEIDCYAAGTIDIFVEWKFGKR